MNITYIEMWGKMHQLELIYVKHTDSNGDASVNITFSVVYERIWQCLL